MDIHAEKTHFMAFPTLTAERIDLLRPFGRERATAAGDVLFEVGDADYDLVVILSGRVEVVDRTGGEHRVLKASGPGEFLAELGLLTGQTVFLACVVREPGIVLMVPSASVRDVVRTVPALGDVLVPAFAARRQLLMQTAAATLTFVGRWGVRSGLGLLEFVDRNRIPHRWLQPDDPEAMALLGDHGTGRADAAVRAIVRGGEVLDDPDNADLARALGLDLAVPNETSADLIVIGTGPAGLSAAVYGASEGLDTVAVDDIAIGGQAGTSSRIENYLGFPTGISGGDLAFRAEVQAIKFGARITVPRRAMALERDGDAYVIALNDGSRLRGRSVVIATGASYRRLGLDNQDAYEGAGLYYAATSLEARKCVGREVVVVGGGNSAGQAAMFLAESARCVHLVYRGASLQGRMSQYLVERLERAPSVRISTRSQIRELRGGRRLESILLENGTSRRDEIRTGQVFVMIGADPCTDWLDGTLELDDHGFIVTGKPAFDDGRTSSPYQTSLPGVFAVGDVRSGSVKRVASAVGEGSVVVQAVHSYLGGRAVTAPA